MDNRNIERPLQLSLNLWGGGGGGSLTGTSHTDSNLYTFERLYAAWQIFRRGKGTRHDVRLYERNLEANLLRLLAQLQTGAYQHGAYTPFTVFDPKQRQIHKASVQDRVVHQLLVNHLEPHFDPRFIYDSFSCRRGKGTHAAITRLRTQLRSASINNTRKVYALKCDVRQFFASVDQARLLQLIERRAANREALALTQTVLQSFSSKPGTGMPLGNVTSQLFANIYLHELDWFVKQHLSEHFYIRYCDDFIILSTSRQHLLDLLPHISQFLTNELQLTLHPHKVVLRSWHQGVDFLGYVLKPNCTLLRTKTKKRAVRRVNETNLSSYRGLCSHANAYRLQQLMATIAW